MLLSSKNSIHTAYRSECHGKCSKQANLLMIVDEKNRRTTAIKNFSRLLKSLNATHKGAYHFYMNCFNSSCIALSRNKHYEYWSSNGHIDIKMQSEKEKCLKFHDGQYQ